MLKKIILAAVLLTMLLSFSAVFADQDGSNRWCNTDDYGCWVTEEDGGKNYILFWSEDARKIFMGSLSKPYTLVVRRPESTLRLEMEGGDSQASAEGADSCQQQYEECLSGCGDGEDCLAQANCISQDQCQKSCEASFNTCQGGTTTE